MRLEGTVEIDEVYVIAGHKGNPAAVAKKLLESARNAPIGVVGKGNRKAGKVPRLTELVARKGASGASGGASVSLTTFKRSMLYLAAELG